MAKAGRKRPQTQTHERGSEAKKRKGEPSVTSNTAVEPTATEPGTASETLYIKNLNDQVKSADLRTLLYMLFSSFGHVVALNAHKSPRMRGQAHVAFGDAEAARAALNALQGRVFLSKPLVLAYARKKSDRLAWLQRDLNRGKPDA